MRRMYSEQELTKIIGEVFDAKIEAGAFDDSISDAVDAYLLEHPIDITALEGLDISVGSLTATGAISGASASISGNITGGSIIENMSGYSAEILTDQSTLVGEAIYVGAVKNGNKLTLAVAMNLTKTATLSGSKNICDIIVPVSIFAKLYPTAIGGYLGLLDYRAVNGIDEDGQFIDLKTLIFKESTNKVRFGIQSSTIDSLPLNKKTYIRIEATFLLNASLIS